MRLTRSLLLGAVCALASMAADAAKKSALDKATMEAYVRHMELLPDQLKITVGDPRPGQFADFLEVPVEVQTPTGVYAIRYLVSKDGQRVIKGFLSDINKNPFQAEMNKLKTDLQPSFGAPGAPVVIVLFSDFQCPACKEEAKLVRDKLAKAYPNDVRVYHKDFPLDGMHPWARSAAIAGRCIFRQNPAAFWSYYDYMYAHQGDITPANVKDKALEFAGEQKLDTLQLTGCIDGKATEKEIEKSIAEGRSLQVSGTPTMFINGRPIQPGTVSTWESLDALIRREIEYQKAAGTTAESCCEVKIPSLVK